MSLSGKVALITGGTSGIGEATVRLFIAEGCHVVFTGRRKALGEALALSLGPHALFVEADHTNPSECERCVAATTEAFGGRVDILFNNAGIVVAGTAEAATEDDWTHVLALNVTAVWRMCKYVLPVMKSQGGGGSIVNNASDWGLCGGHGHVAYCASKGAVVLMTKAMALDHGKDGIRINAVCPGDTAVARWVEEGVPESAWGGMGREFPLGRVGRPDEIAKAVLFLAGDASSYMTGVALPVDGGNTA